MANIRKYTEKDALKMVAKLSAGATLEQALAAVNWSVEDWHRFHTEQKDLQSLYLRAMKDRSTLLLERTLDIEQYLSMNAESLNAGDVARCRLQADILRQVAVAHDSTLQPNQQVKQEESLGLVDLLKRLESEEKEEGVNSNTQSTSSPATDSVVVSHSDTKLTH